jgi:hypothetical protein
MKFLPHLLCLVFLLTATQAVAAEAIKIDQMYALVDGTILKFLRCNTNEISTTNSSSYIAIVVDDAALRNQLSKRYVAFNECFKFKAESEIFFQMGKKGRSDGYEGYIDKATRKHVSGANRFEVVSAEEKKCRVRWSFEYASLGGFTKIVTLVFKDNKWVVVDVQQETVS